MDELRRLTERFLWIVGIVFGVFLIGVGFDHQSQHNSPLGGGAVVGGSIIVAASMVCFYFGRQSKP
jgi:drug/metabolite transporter (DMT)-like permease